MSGTRTSRVDLFLAMALPMVLWAGLVATAVSGPAEPATASPVTLKLTQRQIEAAGIRIARATVATSTLSPSSQARGFRIAGRVVAPGEASGVVLSTVNGQLQAVHVQIGATVRKGQAMARIASPEIAALENEYLKARAAADLADKRLARDESLFADGIISEARLIETRAARELAQAMRMERHRHLALAGFSQAEIQSIGPSSISGVVTLHAPADGIVLAQSVAIGQHVEPGMELFSLSGSRGWWLELHAPSRSVNAIRANDVVVIAGCEPGRVIGVASQLDVESQTYTVRAQLHDTACVRPNQYVEADILPGAIPRGVVSVPASALVRNANRDYVFVEADGGFMPVPVTVERRYGEHVWLAGGIKAGTKVATSGLTALKGAWMGFGPPVGPVGAQ